MGSRQNIQLVTIAVLLTLLIGSVSSFIAIKGFSDPTVQGMVKDMWTVLIMAAGSAIAVIGLGRTVTDAPNGSTQPR